jgi:demethylmenaquinone methyltransferase/2-methoxy-6-polyprenyl-1,4-benzoquinol methylase
VAALPSAVDKPRFVAAMFGRIARRYDLMNTLMTGGQDAVWRSAVARQVGTPRRVLDVGTGTGKLAAAIARRFPASRVVGVDFSEPMLRAGRDGLPMAAADALRLPFADASFDAVVSGFLMRNVADIAVALAEQARVLVPGGRLVVLETAPTPSALMRLYFRHVLPVLGGLIAGDRGAYHYLPESTLAFVQPERLADIMRAHGLTVVSIDRRGFGCVAVTLARKE